jgi:MoaA/NifB/PqqE/SkfB family radical SAM enzyme
MEYLIDISGTCNLRCPSCPVGNFDKSTYLSTPRPIGFMDLEYFKKIVQKITLESKSDPTPLQVTLYNWGEPLIHPEINAIVRYLNQEGVPFNISSNLNVTIDFSEIIRNEPNNFRVSLSGGYNETYQKGHNRGDINLVISNLYKLKHQITKIGLKTRLHVLYHIYRDNCDADLQKIFNLCSELEIPFEVTIAYFMPIEKVMHKLKQTSGFTDRDQATMDRMWVSIDEAVELGKLRSSKTCVLQENQIVINYDGSVALCCGVYDPTHNIAKDFLKISRSDIFENKYTNKLCEECMSMGIHDVLIFNPVEKWDELVTKKQIAGGNRILTRMSIKPNCVINPEYAAKTIDA